MPGMWREVGRGEAAKLVKTMPEMQDDGATELWEGPTWEFKEPGDFPIGSMTVTSEVIEMPFDDFKWDDETVITTSKPFLFVSVPVWDVRIDVSDWDVRYDDGTPIEMNGKGDNYRKVDQKRFDRQFEQIFGVRPKHRCREFIRNENGDPICYHCGTPQGDPLE